MAKRELSATVLGLFLLGCGGEARREQERGPYGWHPVGTPVEVPEKAIIVRIANDSGESVYSVSANAFEFLQRPECSELVVDTCTARTCKGASGLTSPTTILHQVGPLSVTVGGSKLDIPPGGPSVLGEAPLWLGTTEIHVVGGVGETPGFEASVVGPAAVQSLAPNFPGFSDSLEVVWADGINLAWTGGQADQVVHAHVSWSTDTKDFEVTYSTAVDCRFDATSGGGRIPPGILSVVPREGAIPGVWLDVSTRDEATFLAGDYTGTVTAISPGRGAQGELAGGWLTPK